MYVRKHTDASLLAGKGMVGGNAVSRGRSPVCPSPNNVLAIGIAEPVWHAQTYRYVRCRTETGRPEQHNEAGKCDGLGVCSRERRHRGRDRSVPAVARLTPTFDKQISMESSP